MAYSSRNERYPCQWVSSGLILANGHWSILCWASMFDHASNMDRCKVRKGYEIFRHVQRCKSD
ncbi:hypothetical protein THF1C08_50091 [Vibrio jasicida]|uniref:Uncharacterized protein n=1 Tax=Vibrio jasicida TaxID=766224 RepID=A0AAU9QW37_9VIBR|nr:hypothetical protein THF1C08_50091 [Vibrio jasicida]CAH1601843.1 hypothetical protein THF1A12_50257 [Vibrio jasicida]